MRRKQPALFKGRHFDAEIIVLCVRWYLRFSLSFRDLEEMMAERNLRVDHVTIWRWVQRYAPELNRRVVRKSAEPTVRGAATKPMSGWLASGPIYIAPWIRQVPPSIFCYR